MGEAFCLRALSVRAKTSEWRELVHSIDEEMPPEKALNRTHGPFVFSQLARTALEVGASDADADFALSLMRDPRFHVHHVHTRSNLNMSADPAMEPTFLAWMDRCRGMASEEREKAMERLFQYFSEVLIVAFA